MQTDMTVGKPMKMILDFTIPVFIGNVFQQFYNMADAIIVGKFVGTKGLAAVGSTGTIMFLIIGFLTGLTAGFTVLTSQKFGAGKMDEMRQSVGNAALLSIIISVIMTAVSMVGMHSLLTLMHTPEDIFQDAYTYIMIICGGIFAQVLYNILASILRALGNSKTPLYFLILAALLNIVLDLTFIIVFHMGVAGAAWATITAQGVSGVLCLIYIIKYVPELRLKADDWRFRSEIAKKEILVGIPMGLQYSITAIGSVILQASVNTLGSMAVAAVAAGSKVTLFFCCPFDALGGTMATYAGQNVGAGKLDRIKAGLKSSSIIGCIYAVIAFLILVFFSDKIALLFMDAGETETIRQVSMFLIANSAFYIPLVFVNVVRFTIQGMGYSTFAILAGVFEMAARGLAGLVLVPAFGYIAACFGSPLAWIFADIFLFPAFFHCLKTMKRELKEAKQ
mgnify:CR=1 FL=1